MFYMANKLGAWQVGDDEYTGKAAFKLFFPAGFDPEISAIRVAGTFQHLLSGGVDWDFANGLPLARDDSQPEGIFWSVETPLELPANFYEYKYFVQFNDGTTRFVSDPCTRYGGSKYQNAAFVIGGSRPGENTVSDLAGGRKPLRDLIIYEMNIDDFTDEYRGVRAPLDAVTDELDYLAGLGFNAILFMPWTALKHRAYDWGYEPFHYFAVEYRYANDLNRPAEKISWLKGLISACHERGIHVIMDGVFNHASTEFPYKRLYRDQAACPYTGDFGGTFPGLQDLDFNNQCTQDFVRDVCLYWIDIFNIDGIRFDNTVNFYVPDLETKGLKQLLVDIQDHLDHEGKQHFSLTLEHLALDAASLTDGSKATSYWDNSLYGVCFDYLWREQIDSRFLNTLNNRRFLSGEKVPTSYLGNHDHAHVTWQAGARDNLGSMKWYRTQPYVIALYTSTSTPLVQNGQEFGEDHWMPEDDQGSGRRVVPRPLRWKYRYDPIGAGLRRLYTRMAQIRNGYSVVRTGTFEPPFWEEWQTQLNPDGVGVDIAKQIAIYRRCGRNENGVLQMFVVVLNFSSLPQFVTVRFPENGIWIDLLSNYDGSWQPSVANNHLDIVVGSNWGHIFFKNLDQYQDCP